jgi:hypothetical protein
MDQTTYAAAVIDSITELVQPKPDAQQWPGEDYCELDDSVFLRGVTAPQEVKAWYDIDYGDNNRPFAVLVCIDWECKGKTLRFWPNELDRGRVRLTSRTSSTAKCRRLR